MRNHILLFICLMVLVGCGNDTISAKKLSWPPRTHRLDKEAALIPFQQKVTYYIPEYDPVEGKGTGGIDTYGNFLPGDNYKVSGTMISSAGKVKRTASFGDWGHIYSDKSKKRSVGWGEALTSGEMIIPRDKILGETVEGYVENLFEIEDLGDDYFVVKLDKNKGHRLITVSTLYGSRSFTFNLSGTQIESKGRIFTRKADGWYVGEKKVLLTKTNKKN